MLSVSYCQSFLKVSSGDAVYLSWPHCLLFHRTPQTVSMSVPLLWSCFWVGSRYNHYQEYVLSCLCFSFSVFLSETCTCYHMFHWFMIAFLFNVSIMRFTTILFGLQAVCEKYDYKIDNFSSLVDGKAIWCLLDYYFRKELFCSRCLKVLYILQLHWF